MRYWSIFIQKFKDLVPKDSWPNVLAIGLTDFFLMMGYAFCRPTAEGLFLDIVTNKYQPHCYLAIAIGCALFTTLLNRLLRHIDITRLYTGAAALTTISLLFLWGLISNKSTAFIGAFTLNVWKDIFVVILLEQVWSFSNLSFNKQLAPKVFSIFTGIGIIGAILGNKAVKQINSLHLFEPANMLLLSALAIGLSAVAFYYFEHGAELKLQKCGQKLDRSQQSGTALVWKSWYLRWMTLLVFTMQTVITLIDYQFKGMVAINYSGSADKAAFFGNFYFYVNLLALVMLFLAPWLLSKIGALRALWLSPLLLMIAAVAILATPLFQLICLAMILAKGLDYSLTKTAKEILYIPLTFEEKYKAKSVIDMFVYRAAKGLTSGLLILLTTIGVGSIFMNNFCGIFTITALLGWFASLVGLQITRPRKPEQIQLAEHNGQN